MCLDVVDVFSMIIIIAFVSSSSSSSSGGGGGSITTTIVTIIRAWMRSADPKRDGRVRSYYTCHHHHHHHHHHHQIIIIIIIIIIKQPCRARRPCRARPSRMPSNRLPRPGLPRSGRREARPMFEFKNLNSELEFKLRIRSLNSNSRSSASPARHALRAARKRPMFFDSKGRTNRDRFCLQSLPVAAAEFDQQKFEIH